VIDSLVPLLEQGDIVIDGGNSKWTDTIRREKALREKGCASSAAASPAAKRGNGSARRSCPVADPEAYKYLQPVWDAVAAKVNRKTGRPLLGAAPGKPSRAACPATRTSAPMARATT